MSKRLVGGILAIVVIVAAVIVVIAIGGSGTTPNKDNTNTSDNSTDTQQTAQPKTTNSVTIKDYTFSPSTITVKVGTKVTWTNQDAVGHTVTADSGTGPNSELLDQGQSYSFTFDKAGTYAYHCTPHPYMKGTVIVTE